MGMFIQIDIDQTKLTPGQVETLTNICPVDIFLLDGNTIRTDSDQEDECILCELCLQEGRTTQCQMVDHITPINRGGSVWDKSNLQVLCNKCHNIKSGKDRWNKK